MSKEYLEAFKNLKQELYYSPNQIPDIDKWHEIIEEALQRLEAIDNAKPSEALECLKSLDIQVRCIGILDVPSWEKYLPIIKQFILKAQEQEKLLKIIFEKKVDIIYLEDSNTVEKYNSHFGCVICKLTQEEFDLLKRWTKNE